MKKKLLTALTLSLLAMSALSLSLAKSAKISGGDFSTPEGRSSIWSG